jgi:hypothetical protein
VIRPGGKNGEKVHCGVGQWGFVRQPKLTTTNGGSGSIGGGSMIANANNAGLNQAETAAIAAMTNNNDKKAELCSLRIEMNFVGDRTICTSDHGHKNVNNIVLELAEHSTSYSGKLYELYSDNTKKLHIECNTAGDYSCRWIKTLSSTPPKQIFKFNNYFVSDSPLNPQRDQSKKTNAYQNIIVYENKNGVWSDVGYLGISDDKKFFLSVDQAATSTRGILHTSSNLIYQQVTTLRMKTTGVVAGGVVEAGFNTAGTVFRNEKQGLKFGDDVGYKWLSGGEVECPAGYYLHQVRCKHDQMCTKRELGCIKARSPNCVVDGTSKHTVPFIDGSFVSCQHSHVVVGLDNDKIHCARLETTRDSNITQFGFPTLGEIGSIVNENPGVPPFSQRSPSDDGNWLGNPIQALVPARVSNDKPPFVNAFYYGNKCNVQFVSSRAKTRNTADFTVDVSSPSMKKCPKNMYVAFVKCDGKGCFHGLEVYCEIANECVTDGGGEFIVSATDDEQPVCPYSTVLVGLQCVDESIPEEPCRKLKITCREMRIDPGYHPVDPAGGGGDSGNGNTTRIIIIALATGVPLLVVAAIVCLYCIPENKSEQPGNDASAETRINIAKMGYNELRHRKSLLMSKEYI